MATLTLHDVTKTFDATTALAGFDLDVVDGELISLLGPSGCGKTTALRIVAGFEHPDVGDVRVDGRSLLSRSPDKRGMGMVFQAYSLFPHLTAADNVAFGLRMRREKAASTRAAVGEMLELVGLSHRADAYPHQMSGGQQQRIALARALAIRPTVLLLDEPLSALDAQVRTQLGAEIRRIQTELSITTLFVTHDQGEALALADRVGVMSDGRLEQLASPAEVYEHPATAFVARFVGRSNELTGQVAGRDAVTVEGVALRGIALNGHTAGDAVTVLVRPEHLTPLHEAAAGTLPGRIVSVGFHGPRSELLVTLPSGASLAVDLPTSQAGGWGAGDDVHLQVAGARARVDAAAV